MKYFGFALVLLLACDNGGGLIVPDEANTFSRITEGLLNEIFQSSETYSAASADAIVFSSITECETKNELFINNDEIKLVRTSSANSDFGTDFFAFDTQMQYAIIVSLFETRNHTYSVSEFINQGGNDVLIYRLRSTGPGTFRIISLHTLREEGDGQVSICVASNGIVFSGNDLIFNRISTFVSLNFRARQLN